MDLGLVASLWSAKNIPPGDFWFAGEKLNTYYLGSWSVAALGRAGRVSPWHSYFLGLVVVWTQVLASCMFVHRAWNLRGRGGVFLPFLILLMPNAAFIMNWKKGIPLFHDGFIPNFSRIIPFTINENPSIAFWISELHAHVMALPLFILVAVCLHHALLKRNYKLILPCAFLASGIFMTDAWLVLPAAFFIFVVAVWGARGSLLFVVKFMFLFLVATLALSSAFLADFKGYPFRLLRVMNSTTTPLHLLILFGPLLILALPGAIRWKRQKTIWGTGMILLLVSLVIILFCELWYVDNRFPPPGERQNTVFRFHYAAWIFLSLSAFALWQKGNKRKTIQCLAWIVIIFFWMSGSIIPGIARLIPEKGSWTMDLRLALDPKREGLVEASQWLFENTPPGTVIAESGGEPYRLLGTVSSMSGRTALLGEIDKVQNHGIEMSRVENRLGKLYDIYLDRPEAENVIREFGIDYIIVSPREKTAFPGARLPSLNYRYQEVFVFEKTSILRVEKGGIGSREETNNPDK